MKVREEWAVQVRPQSKTSSLLLRNAGHLVLSGKYAYKDIVILVQNARTDTPIMVDYFQKLHIPIYYDGGQTFYP